MQFHIQRFEPSPNWPNGGWSLYRITGDEIASRIELDHNGRVIRRDSWPGYICTAESLSTIFETIDEETKK